VARLNEADEWGPGEEAALRAGDADRELYQRTKRELAARDWTYIQQYADAKSAVVEEILRRS